MFHRIRHIHFDAIDACGLKRLIEQFACGSDKWLAFEIFLVTWLLADEQHFGVTATFAKHRLGCVFVEIATSTAFGRNLQLWQRWTRRNKWRSRADVFASHVFLDACLELGSKTKGLTEATP
jgi:hypothetical protein